MPTLALSIAVNAAIFNYGELHRQGETISTVLVESTTNPVVSAVRETPARYIGHCACHLLLANADQSAENDLEGVFRRCYPLFRADA